MRRAMSSASVALRALLVVAFVGGFAIASRPDAASPSDAATAHARLPAGVRPLSAVAALPAPRSVTEPRRPAKAPRHAPRSRRRAKAQHHVAPSRLRAKAAPAAAPLRGVLPPRTTAPRANATPPGARATPPTVAPAPPTVAPAPPVVTATPKAPPRKADEAKPGFDSSGGFESAG
jgi:hypothetical protein